MLASVLLLSACGKTETQNEGHAVAGKEDTMDQSKGHGEHQEKKQEPASDQVQVKWKLSEEKPQAKAETKLSFTVLDEQGNRVENFDLNHEKKMHLIIVSKDLAYFNHIHPEYKVDGEFEIATTFPAGGDYKLVADFIPSGKSAATRTTWVNVQGKAAPEVSITPDSKLDKTVDGYSVSLSADTWTAGKELMLNFHIKEAATDKPVADLEPYLGAVGHVVIMSEDTEQYLHVHPMDESAKGPDAQFMTTFPKAGVYKIWGQFQHRGKVFVVPFVVQVT